MWKAYNDKFQVYDSLMFCGYRHLKIEALRLPTGKVYTNGLKSFCNFSKECLIKHHGVSRTWFPFYLKELEFRYNHRRVDIFPVTCQYVCGFLPLVPNRD